MPAKGPTKTQQIGLLDPHFPTEHQRAPTPPTQIPPPLPHQAMALRRKREITVGARAFIDIARHASALDVVGVAAIGRQFVHATHDQLPLFAVGLDAIAKQLMCDQVGDFMGHGLLEEVFSVFAVQLRIETQKVLVQMRDTGFLPAQLEAHHGAFEGSFEKGFGLLVTVFDAGIELLGHA